MTAEADSLYSVDRPRLTALLSDEPRYRVEQIWRGLYVEHRVPAEMTNLPLALRERLEAALPAELTLARDSVSEGGMTHKYLWRLDDGATIESVLMHSPDRSTVCVSTQAGCAMACSFCATGQAGFDRHLRSGEIVAQVVEAARRAEGRRVSNVVFMGMGEPLHHYDVTRRALEILTDPAGISLGFPRITVSTVGLAPRIAQLGADFGGRIQLAVSVNAGRQATRARIMPIGATYDLDALRAAIAAYPLPRNRYVLLEYVLLAGLTDTPDELAALAAWVRDLPAIVNLIPFNPFADAPETLQSPADADVSRAFATLRAAGVPVSVRQPRGRRAVAACGQLARLRPE